MLDIAHLRGLLDYDPEFGDLFWKKGRGGMAAGDLAGYIAEDGYYKVSINNKPYLSHKIAWFHYYGEYPKHAIAHIDGDKLNNSIANLRFTDRQRTARAARITYLNKSGIKGVGCRKNGVWKAQITVSGRLISLGHYKELIDAAYARFAAEQCITGWLCDDINSSALEFINKWRVINEL